MLGNNQVQVPAPGYATAFMKSAASSNLYFTNGQLPAAQMAQLSTVFNTGTMFNPSAPGSTKYLQGYETITVNLTGNNLNFMLVPVFPQQMPHLVALSDFKAGLNSPDPTNSTPPNAVQIQSQAAVTNVSTFAGALACAIVGCANDQGYSASLPAGYIEIFNRPGYNPFPVGTQGPIDMGNNIFNNEMWGTPGVSLTVLPSGGINGTTGTAVFSCAASVNFPQPTETTNPRPLPGPTLLDDWGAYNNGTVGTQPPLFNQKPPYNDETENPLDEPIYIANDQKGVGWAASSPSDVANLQQVKSPTNYTGQNQNNCMYMEINTGWLTTGPPDCLDWMPCIAATYHRSMPDGTLSGPPPDLSTLGPVFSNVDIVKMALIEAFWHGHLQNLTVYAPTTPTYSGAGSSMNGSTGIGLYVDAASGAMQGVNFDYPSPFNSMPIDESQPAIESSATLATPWAYMQQVYSAGGTCTGAVFPYPSNPNQHGVYPSSAPAGTLFAAILQRCQQIQPSVTAHDVAQLLDSTPLPMGSQYYIYLPNANQNSTSGPIGKGLVLNAGPPPAFSGQVPDGVPLSSSNECYGTYDLKDNQIDVPRNPPCGYPELTGTLIHQGDLDVHNQMYTVIKAANDQNGNPLPDLTGNDFALWQDSSGAGNLLGHLEFANTVTGANYFSTPN